MSTTPRCECVLCCDGEHPGECKECAGWGEAGGEPCDYCNETGVCPECAGAGRWWPASVPTKDDWGEFYAGYDDDAWECDLCGGEGFREYLDAPEEWGEDCPSEMNHLIRCRGCEEIERAKRRAMVAFMLKKEGRHAQ